MIDLLLNILPIELLTKGEIIVNNVPYQLSPEMAVFVATACVVLLFVFFGFIWSLFGILAFKNWRR